jgi:hypothetical protein
MAITTLPFTWWRPKINYRILDFYHTYVDKLLLLINNNNKIPFCIENIISILAIQATYNLFQNLFHTHTHVHELS